MIVVPLLFLAAGLALASEGDDSTTIEAEELVLTPRDYLQKFHAELRRHQNNAKNDSDLPLQPRDRLQEFHAELKERQDSNSSKIVQTACTKKLSKVSLSPGDYAIIVSKNHPNDYPRKSKCKWKFTTTAGNYFSVYCVDFDLQRKNRRGKCSDYFKLNNDKFCGTDAPQYYSSYDQMFVQFRANKKKHYTGFYCYIVAISPWYSTSNPSSTTEPPNPGSTEPPKPRSTLEPGSVKCGVPNRATRIVGGVETTVNEYPWQAAMVDQGTTNSFCGGSVISTKYVITAAHCTQATKDYGIAYDVLLGAHCLNSPAGSQMRFKPQKYIQHNQYNDNTMDNDISIIILKTAINFETSEIRPICLPPKTAGTFNGDVATVSGWGALTEGGSGPKCLHEVDVPVISNTKCQKYNSHASISTNMICAGYDKGNKDSCQGDSGGPMFFDSGCGYEQIGVVSFGYGCARPKLPGVYARVTEYIDWISSKLGGYPTYSCR